MPWAACLTPGDDLRRPGKMEEPHTGAVAAQLIAVLAFERRATHHAAVLVTGQPPRDRLEPRVPVIVVERVTGRHLGDVDRRVEVVGVGGRHPQALRERGADS